MPGAAASIVRTPSILAPFDTNSVALVMCTWCDGAVPPAVSVDTVVVIGIPALEPLLRTGLQIRKLHAGRCCHLLLAAHS